VHTKQQTDYLQYIEAHVYIGTGVHFFFQCDGDETTNTFSDTLYTSMVNYCNLNLKKANAVSDNVMFFFKLLECSSAKSLGIADDNNFKAMCITYPAYRKPVIYVNQANSYFNISGTYTFENMKFTGVNAFA
jgi:hypothetical protein